MLLVLGGDLSDFKRNTHGGLNVNDFINHARRGALEVTDLFACFILFPILSIPSPGVLKLGD